jgi:hypothetical protein
LKNTHGDRGRWDLPFLKHEFHSGRLALFNEVLVIRPVFPNHFVDPRFDDRIGHFLPLYVLAVSRMPARVE